MSQVGRIVPACQWVVGQAGHVKIKAEKIPEYAAFILGKYPLLTGMGTEMHHVVADREETAAYILALDSINFGSGYFYIARSCGLELEYAVIAHGLKKFFEQGTLKHPAQWARVTAAAMAGMISIPQGAHPQLDELTVLLAQHLKATGEKVLVDYQGRVLNLLEQADYSAVKLADTVAVWPGFCDVRTYKGREIPTLKRAQILAADMNLALGGFTDMAALTIFADNMVPHVLRCDGVLEYDAALAAQIDAGVPLIAGSEEETEIRAAAIYAVELMKQAAQQQGRRVTSVNIDHLLWHRGYEPELYSKLTHRTLTADY